MACIKRRPGVVPDRSLHPQPVPSSTPSNQDKAWYTPALRHEVFLVRDPCRPGGGCQLCPGRVRQELLFPLHQGRKRSRVLQKVLRDQGVISLPTPNTPTGLADGVGPQIRRILRRRREGHIFLANGISSLRKSK